jgi:hypothetical protein
MTLSQDAAQPEPATFPELRLLRASDMMRRYFLDDVMYGSKTPRSAIVEADCRPLVLHDGHRDIIKIQLCAGSYQSETTPLDQSFRIS